MSLTWYIDPANGNTNNAGSSFVLQATATDGVTNGTTKFTSGSGLFTAGMVGQRIHILTKGYYTVSGYTDANTITLSSTVTTASGLTWYIGGSVVDINGLSGIGTSSVDFIHIAKTSDPIQISTATFTNKSDTISLSASLTLNITTCESAWTADNSSTVGTAAGKEGTNCATISTTTTAQLRGHFATGTLDLSGYTNVSFWMKSSVAQTTNTLQITLCSDSSGTVPVHIILITDAFTANNWRAITWKNGVALNSGINSIALTTFGGIAAGTISIDNVIACNTLDLTSLVSKTSLTATNIYGEQWHPIKSINGTTIKVSAGANSLAATTQRGYSGITETVPIYCRATQRIYSNSIQTFGTGTIIGGYDTTSDIQTGETWWDLADAFGSNLILNESSIYSLNVARGTIPMAVGLASQYYGCVTDAGGQEGIEMAGHTCSVTGSAICCATYGLWVSTVGIQAPKFQGLFNSNGSDGINMSSITIYPKIIGNIVCNNNAGNGFNMGGGGLWGTANCIFNDNAADGLSINTTVIADTRLNISISAYNNSSYGVRAGAVGGNVTPCDGIYLRSVSTSGNTTGGYGVGVSKVTIGTSNFAEATKIGLQISGYPYPGEVTIHKYQNTYGDTRTYKMWGTIQTVTGTTHSVSGYSWQLTSTAVSTTEYPLYHKLEPVAVDNTPTTYNMWVMDQSTSGYCGIGLFGGDLFGVESDISTNTTQGVSGWQNLSLSFTGSEPYGGFTPIIFTSNNFTGFFDDSSFS